MRRPQLVRLSFAILLLAAHLAGAAEPYPPVGIVVSVCPLADRVGSDVLERGGNAVDAAIAVALALAVTWPEAGNIGGGGFMLVAAPGSDVVCVEYRETAPIAAGPQLFAPQQSTHTLRYVGVPGTVAGLALAHQTYGSLPWRDLVQPAIDLAQDGFVVSAALADSLNDVLADSPSVQFVELHRVYGPSEGKPWQAGQTLILPDLANSLQILAEQGPDAFYRGPIAAQLADGMRRDRGLIARDDLTAYRAHLRQPIRGTFRGYEIFGPPPPSSGGICLVEMLNTLEHFDLAKQGRTSPDTLHFIAEAMKLAFRDRARWLGDSAFTEIPAWLTAKPYAASLAARIDPHRATPSAQLAAEIPLAPESPSTTHFTILDARGMVVSNTYTLEQSFGARQIVPGTGFLLNNEMGDFNLQAGDTNRHGAIGTAPNLIAPGKRMLSSQTPCLVFREGRLVLATGSPGGRTIINTVLTVLLNSLEFELDPRDAIGASRIHHAWMPDLLLLESSETDPRLGWSDKLTARIEELRHPVKRLRDTQGDAHSIFWDRSRGTYLGVHDPRRQSPR
jgi:gamma-glutamyltranspeptidase/glutathione hydrolase